MKVIPFAAMAVMLFVACPEMPADNFQPQLNVFGVIRNDRSDGQQLVIDRTYAMEDSNGYDLHNVVAVMTQDTLCDTLELYSINDVGFFVGFFYPLDTLRTYRIMVSADGLDTLLGETTVPGAFDVIFPQPGDTVKATDTVLIRKSENGRVYEFQFFQNDTIPYLAGSFPDFLPDSMFRFAASEFNFMEGNQVMRIAAYDSNYFNYQYNFGGGEYPRCGVQGGLGAFCSAYVNSVNFYYQP